MPHFQNSAPKQMRWDCRGAAEPTTHVLTSSLPAHREPRTSLDIKPKPSSEHLWPSGRVDLVNAEISLQSTTCSCCLAGFPAVHQKKEIRQRRECGGIPNGSQKPRKLGWLAGDDNYGVVKNFVAGKQNLHIVICLSVEHHPTSPPLLSLASVGGNMSIIADAAGVARLFRQ